MTTYSPLTSRLMANHDRRSHTSFLISSVILLLVCIQGPSVAVAQANQYDSMLASNHNARTNSASSTVAPQDDGAYDAAALEIYDDPEDFDDASSTLAPGMSQSKFPLNKTAHVAAQPEELTKNEYEDESDAYHNEENPDDESTLAADQSNVYVDSASGSRPDMKSPGADGSQKKGSDVSSTSRLPFVPSNLWRELFSKPGILVGIIGGVVIGMLSAILLVMFIIYRMRKKDEGSYALEEGPRKSPSHAYTRVSSREFFA